MDFNHITPNQVDELSAADRNDYTYAVAIAAATVAPLPSMPVEAPGSYFEQNCKTTAARIAGAFNEVRTLDFARCQELIKELWQTRYVMAHGLQDGQDVPGVGLHCTILSLFGADTYLSNDTRKYLEEHTEGIRQLQYSCNVAARRLRDFYMKTGDNQVSAA